MVLGIEIAATILGLYMLITGKTIGKNAIAHVQLRFLGAFLITLLPVAFVAIMIFGIVWLMSHPGSKPETIGDEIKWPAMGIEFGIAVVYAVIGTFWEKAIRRKVEAGG